VVVLFEVPKIFQKYQWYYETDRPSSSCNGVKNAFMASLEAVKENRN